MMMIIVFINDHGNQQRRSYFVFLSFFLWYSFCKIKGHCQETCFHLRKVISNRAKAKHCEDLGKNQQKSHMKPDIIGNSASVEKRVRRQNRAANSRPEDSSNNPYTPAKVHRQKNDNEPEEINSSYSIHSASLSIDANGRVTIQAEPVKLNDNHTHSSYSALRIWSTNIWGELIPPSNLYLYSFAGPTPWFLVEINIEFENSWGEPIWRPTRNYPVECSWANIAFATFSTTTSPVAFKSNCGSCNAIFVVTVC